MNKTKFIKKLELALQSRLPQEEVKKAIPYYEELINDRQDLGEIEEDIIDSLGSIEYIVKVISIENLEKRESTNDIRSIMSSSTSLLRLATTPILVILAFVFGTIMFSLTLALAGTFIGFAISLISLGASAIYSIVLIISSGSSFSIGLVVLGAHLFAFGILLIVAILFKDLLYLCINKSIKAFTKIFKKKVV